MLKGKKSWRDAPGAEHAGKSKPPGVKPLQLENTALLRELKVHQIQLELQNEELRSARLQTEAALARYTELFEFAPIGYATVWADHGIWDINYAAAQLLGKERSRLRGQRFDLLVSPDYRDAFLELVRSARVSGGKQGGELELSSPGVPSLMVRLSASVLLRAEPKIVLAFEDISESKRREHELERTERALREAQRRKAEFLATLSDELHNPLAPIRNSVSVLGRSAPGSDAAEHAQVVIDRQVSHLTRWIDDLLDVTRIAAS